MLNNDMWDTQVIVPILLLLFFLPSVIALICNRRDKKKILVANILSGLSWIAWVGVLMWALTGDYLRAKMNRKDN